MTGSAEPRPRVLVVDDEPAMRRGLARALLAHGFAVDTAESGAAALDLLRTRGIDVALVDRDMPEVDGPTVLAQIKHHHPAVEVVLMTALGDVEATAIVGAQAGAAAVVGKPIASAEAVCLALERAAERRRLLARASEPGERGIADAFGELPGTSLRIKQAYRKALDAARTEQTVLLLGERGTGKELVARAIHRSSNRAAGPLHVVAVGALPADRIEDELFGAAEPGSRPRPGALELADGGTLVLDEVGELPPAAQHRLLRALAAGEYLPRGATEPRSIDARVVSTSHDLRERVAAGRFREDLFYRLSVVAVTLPPLRRRREDIPLLAYHFVHRFAPREGRSIRRISAEALRKLRDHPWPGNVRELERAIERGVVMARGEAILPADLDLAEEPERDDDEAEQSAAAVVLSAGDLTEVPYPDAKERATLAFDVAYVERVMARAGGNVSEAARLAGMDRSNFRRLLKKAHPGRTAKARRKRGH